MKRSAIISRAQGGSVRTMYIADTPEAQWMNHLNSSIKFQVDYRTLDTYSWPAYYPLRAGNSWALVSARHNRKSSLNAALFDGSAIGIPAKQRIAIFLMPIRTVMFMVPIHGMQNRKIIQERK